MALPYTASEPTPAAPVPASEPTLAAPVPASVPTPASPAPPATPNSESPSNTKSDETTTANKEERELQGPQLEDITCGEAKSPTETPEPKQTTSFKVDEEREGPPVKKRREERPQQENRGDAWSLYMSEILKWRNLNLRK